MADEREPPHPPRTAAKPKGNHHGHKPHMHAKQKGAPLDLSARARHSLKPIHQAKIDANQSDT